VGRSPAHGTVEGVIAADDRQRRRQRDVEEGRAIFRKYDATWRALDGKFLRAGKASSSQLGFRFSRAQEITDLARSEADLQRQAAQIGTPRGTSPPTGGPV
jgi:hypothetical protein